MSLQEDVVTIVTVPMMKSAVNNAVVCLPTDLGSIVAEYAVGPMYSLDWSLNEKKEPYLVPKPINGLYVTANHEFAKRVYVGTLSHRLERNGILCSSMDVLAVVNEPYRFISRGQRVFYLDGSPYGRLTLFGDVYREGRETTITCWNLDSSRLRFSAQHRPVSSLTCEELTRLRMLNREKKEFPVEIHTPKVVSPANRSLKEVQFTIADYLVMFCNNNADFIREGSIEWIFEPTPIAMELPQLLEYNTHAVTEPKG